MEACNFGDIAGRMIFLYDSIFYLIDEEFWGAAHLRISGWFGSKDNNTTGPYCTRKMRQHFKWAHFGGESSPSLVGRAWQCQFPAPLPFCSHFLGLLVLSGHSLQSQSLGSQIHSFTPTHTDLGEKAKGPETNGPWKKLGNENKVGSKGPEKVSLV